MGWLAERIGMRAVVIFGGAMIGTGLTSLRLGGLSQLYVSSLACWSGCSAPPACSRR